MKNPGRKLAAIAVVIVFITSLSGFFMGLLQTSRQAADSRLVASNWAEPTPTYHAADVPVAPRYVDLHHHLLQPNRDWQSQTANLPRIAPQPDGTELILSVVDQQRQRAARAERRAYAGAPPISPHPVDQMSSAACLACHGNPVRVGNLLVPQISHPPYSQCLQCHAAGPGPSSSWTELIPPPSGTDFAAIAASNSFDGHHLAEPGARAFDSAPAVIPHTTWMRENCMSCHGPGGSSALRTSHPSRQSCTQCHPLNPDLEQHPVSLAPFLANTNP